MALFHKYSDARGNHLEGLTFDELQSLFGDSDSIDSYLDGTVRKHQIKPKAVWGVNYDTGGVFLDINGLTEQTDALADADKIPVYINAIGSPMKMAGSKFKSSVLGTPMIWDESPWGGGFSMLTARTPATPVWLPSNFIWADEVDSDFNVKGVATIWGNLVLKKSTSPYTVYLSTDLDEKIGIGTTPSSDGRVVIQGKDIDSSTLILKGQTNPTASNPRALNIDLADDTKGIYIYRSAVGNVNFIECNYSGSPYFEVDKNGYVKIAGTKVLGTQQGAIADADGTLADLTTKFNTWLSYARTHGLIAT